MEQKKKCKNCGKWFVKKQYISQKRWNNTVKFCSKECHYNFGKVEVGCKNCGKTFTKWKYIDTIKFCCKKCRIEYRKSHDNEYGGFKKGHEAFITTHWLGKKRSEETKRKISKANKGNPKVLARAKLFAETHSGKNHWNWKGGITSEMKKLRHSKEYDEWRFAVYKRDHYSCQMCKNKCGTKDIVAHHLDSFKEFPEKRYEVNNGLTLCRKCHKIVHKEIGLKTRFKKNRH